MLWDLKDEIYIVLLYFQVPKFSYPNPLFFSQFVDFAIFFQTLKKLDMVKNLNCL